MPIVGQKYVDAVQVGRTTVPLPEGEWTVMASQERQSNSIDGSAPARMAAVIFGKLRESSGRIALDGTIQVVANRDTQSIRWARDTACWRTDWLHIENNYSSEIDQRCMIVRSWNTNFQYGQNWNPEERAAVDWARTNGVDLTPTTFLGTRYRIVNRTDLATIIYYSSNMSLGVVSHSDVWHPVARGRNPQVEATFLRYVQWAKEWESQVIAGMEGRLATRQQPAKNAAPVTSVPATADRASRLRELESLRSQGLLTQDEYRSRRQRILDGI